MPLAYTLACSSCAPGPTDPVPRGLLTLWARADVCMHVCMYVYTRSAGCACTRRLYVGSTHSAAQQKRIAETAELLLRDRAKRVQLQLLSGVHARPCGLTVRGPARIGSVGHEIQYCRRGHTHLTISWRMRWLSFLMAFSVTSRRALWLRPPCGQAHAVVIQHAMQTSAGHANAGV